MTCIKHIKSTKFSTSLNLAFINRPNVSLDYQKAIISQSKVQAKRQWFQTVKIASTSTEYMINNRKSNAMVKYRKRKQN